MSAHRQQSNILSIFGHTAVFVTIYLVLMLPTYALPFFGSNSAVLSGSYSGATNEISPATILHVVTWLLIIALTGVRGKIIGKLWIVVLPVIGTVFDFMPVLSSIPLVITVLHIVTIILGVALTPRPTEPATHVQPGAN